MQELSDETCFPTEDRILHAVPSNLATLDLLSEVCDVLPARAYKTMSIQELDDYRNFLRVLDWRIRGIPASTNVNENPETAKTMELYQLAMLVYLNRVSGNLLDQSARTQQQIDKAFALFSQLSSCERQFPVFILGCEARTDYQRAIMLDLISRTEKRLSSRSLNHVKILIHAIWAQDDLSDRNLDYEEKLSSIISCCSIMPSLV